MQKNIVMVDFQLLQKYNVAIPRYTSYPTVPNWKEELDANEWENSFKHRFSIDNKANGISLYLHLPFCESLCTYCGCNKKITTNHNVEDEYITAILKEWNRYRNLMNEPPVIREIHLGGGTPTFFAPENLKKLINSILENSVLHPQHDFSIEGHPNNTTREHLQTLYNLGFRRVSFGVQDLSDEVQRVINRYQPFSKVKEVTETAREIGFLSINFDLIYGLPLQTQANLEYTLLQCITLKPERVAFYSYAHVPWTSKGQRLFDENDLPSVDEKMKLYQLGKRLFSENGYYDIGMDHFSLPEDNLYQSFLEGKLHRNFMGYTTQKSAIMIGLGVSSISDTGYAFAQNAKILQEYYNRINAGESAVTKGYFLNEEDLCFKRYVLDISCKGKTTFKPEFRDLLEKYTIPELKKLEADELVVLTDTGVEATAKGRHFIRNICGAFDMYLLRSNLNAEDRKFSRAI